MPKYRITLRSGKQYIVTAPDKQSAARALLEQEGGSPRPAPQQHHPQAQQREMPWTSPEGAGATAADVAKSIGVGVGKAAIGTVGAPADLAGMAGAGIDWLANKAGYQPSGRPLFEGGPTAEQLAIEQRGKMQALTSGGIKGAVEAQTGPFYQPRTRLGEIGQTTGEMAANAVAPGGLVRRGLQVALPTAAKEITRSVTRNEPGMEAAPDIAGAVTSFGTAGIGSRAGITQAGRDRAAAGIAASNAPDYETVRQMRDAVYGQLRQAGVRFDANHYQQFAADLVQRLGGQIDAGLHPSAYRVMRQIIQRARQGQSPSFDDVENLRKNANTAQAGIDPKFSADRRFAGDLSEALDDLYDNAPFITNASIPANVVAPMVRQARELGSRTIKAERIQLAEELANSARIGDVQKLRGEFENIKRQQDRRRGRGSTPLERASVRDVTRETLPRAMSVGKARPFITAALGSVAGAPLAMISPALPAIIGGASLAAPFAMKPFVNAGIRRAADRATGTVLAGRAGQTAAQQQQRENFADMLRRLGLSSVIGTTGLRE